MHDAVFIHLMDDCCPSKNYCNKRETDDTTFSCVVSIFEKSAKKTEDFCVSNFMMAQQMLTKEVFQLYSLFKWNGR